MKLVNLILVASVEMVNYHSDRAKSLYFSIFFIYKSSWTYCSPADQAAVYCSVLDFIPCSSLTERTDF